MLRRMMVGVAAAAVLCGVTATAASAETAVQAAILREDVLVAKSPGLAVVKNIKKYKVANLGKVAPEVAALGRLYTTAATTVAKVTPASSQERVGQKDWVAGTREGAIEFADLAKQLVDISKSDAAGARTEGAAVTKAAHIAVTLLKKGDAILGLPKGA